MLIIIALALGSLLWLTHRFSLLLSIPIGTSVKNLSIPIPKVPLISVDKVTDTSIVLHWNDVSGASDDTTLKSDKKEVKEFQTIPGSNTISQHVLYINGIETVRIDGTQKKCTLEGLQPGSNYQIDLVAFNLAGFRSRSSPIFIKTSSKPIKDMSTQSLENPDNVMQCLLHEQERAVVTKNDPFKASITSGRSRSGTIEGNSTALPIFSSHNPEMTPANSNNNSNATSNNGNNNAKHPHLIDDINELKWILESGLEEVQSLMKSYKETELEFKEEEMNLLSARNEAKERKKFEDNNRMNLRQEIKLLEEQRVKGTGRISADEKKIKERLKKIENFNSQIEKWHKEIEKMKNERAYIMKENPEMLKKLILDVENLSKDIFSTQVEVHDVEDDLRVEIATRKSLESQKIIVFKLFEDINKNIDDVTGLLRKDGMEVLNELFELKPEWKDELYNEIVAIDEKAESDWKLLQQKEWLNFNNMKNEIDEQKRLSLLSNNNNNNNLNGIGAELIGVNGTNTITGTSATTTATNTTNVNGYLYNSLPSSSAASINGYNNQSFNNNSMRGLMRPRISTNGSFHGGENMVRQDSGGNTFNSANNSNLWNSLNLSLETKNLINPVDDSIDSPNVKMLLPQDLIDGKDFDQIFETQSMDQQPQSNASMMPPLTSSSLNKGNNTLSPKISQLNTFDVYSTNNINGLVLNSTPQNNRVTSLGVLASGNSQNSILGAPTSINMLGSPQSINAHLAPCDNGLSSNILDLGQAATTSPFTSNTQLNINLNGNANNNTGSDLDHSNLFNQNSVLLGSGNIGDTNHSHYSKIFGSLNGGNTNNNIDANLNDNGKSMDFTMLRGRSTSFGSSIWSNGNNSNVHHGGNGTWGSNNNVPGFSFLGAPISMTSTAVNDDSTGGIGYNNHMILTNLDKESRLRNGKSMHSHQSSMSKSGITTIASSNGNTGEAENADSHFNTQPSSPSFLKSMMGKLGSSPTKTTSNRTIDNHNDQEFEDSVEDNIHNRSDIMGNSGNHSMSTSAGTVTNASITNHHKNTSFGSSRFFKLSRKNSVISNSQYSALTNSSADGSLTNSQGVLSHAEDEANGNSNVGGGSSSGGGFMGRKLSFAFKRDKERD